MRVYTEMWQSLVFKILVPTYFCSTRVDILTVYQGAPKKVPPVQEKQNPRRPLTADFQQDRSD